MSDSLRHRTSVFINKDVHRHLNRAAVARRFRVPSANDMRLVGEGFFHSVNQPLARAINRANDIAADHAHRLAHALTDGRTGMLGIGGRSAVRGGTTRHQRRQAQQTSGGNKRACDFHGERKFDFHTMDANKTARNLGSAR